MNPTTTDMPRGKKYNLSAIDCEVYAIYERRNLLTGALDNYHHPIEIVIGVPASMGERGIMISVYYDEYPTQHELYKDAKQELKEWIKPENFLTAGIYCPGAYDELRIKAMRKALKVPLTPLERFEKWMHKRGKEYKKLEVKYFMDGEPYFESEGAEMSLSDFLKRETELSLPPHSQYETVK